MKKDLKQKEKCAMQKSMLSFVQGTKGVDGPAQESDPDLQM